MFMDKLQQSEPKEKNEDRGYHKKGGKVTAWQRRYWGKYCGILVGS